MKNIFTLFVLLLISALMAVSQNVQSINTDDEDVLMPKVSRLADQGNDIAFSNSINYSVTVPNAFSPNGDGINDYFKISGIEKFPDARLYVYTASNKKVFEKSHYGNLDFWGNEADAWWDGTNNIRSSGTQLPNGTYIYILDLANGNQKLIKLGTVYIRR